MNDSAVHAHSAVRTLPGGLGIWILMLNELLLFGIWFVGFSYYEGSAPAVFAAGRGSIGLELGVVQTLILLAGSWCVARAVLLGMSVLANGQPVKQKASACRRWLLGGVMSGLAFLTIKAVSYTTLIAAGHTIQENRFFLWFFMITAYHAVHVALATTALGIVAGLVSRGTIEPSHWSVRVMGLFWHLVDLLWIMIFTVVYAL
jgi:nitric oxide reductase NorE protein